MHNYFKRRNIFQKFDSSIFIKDEVLVKCKYSYLSKNFSLFLNNGFIMNQGLNCFPIREINKNQNFLKKKKNKFLKLSQKNFYERKSMKWYWREKNYDMLDGDIYKNYLIKYKDNFHIELIPQVKENTKAYDSCLIWLYDGDFPEYFIEHLLEFNNFPPKVFISFL